ncbi:MAG: GTP-binding protein [Candidatus Aenigmatarchaeota archaeon]|nr:MAG: GTP-binding protein [Candidatus Aenigmarchaeota archaeon]
MVFRVIKQFFARLFGGRKEISLGLYGPPNTGKSTLANRISKDFGGGEFTKVSEIPHETRMVKKKEKLVLESNGHRINMNLLDMPGIATRVDYKDFVKYGMAAKKAKNRSKEATKGIVEAIKWLDNVDACLVVFDSTDNPYTQVNVTILGNLESKKIPILLVANKVDLKGAKPERVKDAFPQYPCVEISAKQGKNMDALYEKIVKELA